MMRSRAAEAVKAEDGGWVAVTAPQTFPARFPCEFRKTNRLSRVTVQQKTDTGGLNPDTSAVCSHADPAVAVDALL
jgi:hypothetical protein